MIDKKRSIVDTHIAQIKASSFVHNNDDIEVFDWSRANLLHSLWYCDNLSESLVLKSALIKALKRSCHSQVVPMLFPKKKRSSGYQFIGFVSSHIKGGNVLSGFHPSSFVIF